MKVVQWWKLVLIHLLINLGIFNQTVSIISTSNTAVNIIIFNMQKQKADWYRSMARFDVSAIEKKKKKPSKEVIFWK